MNRYGRLSVDLDLGGGGGYSFALMIAEDCCWLR